jgi:ATP-dependent RNA helicase HrpB
VTIEGVTAVIDSGLARMAAHSPWTGLPTLALGKISRAAATQRTGRAGRTRPGRALRLYTRHDFEQRRYETEPEIARADLADLALTLASLGVGDADALAWLEPPPAAAWGVARELLGRLGAVDKTGQLTDVGRRMARLPVHPRLARLVVEGEARGVGAAAALAAALISERDIRAGARASFGGGGGFAAGARPDRGADVLDLVDLFQQAADARFRPDVVRRLDLDRRATEEVDRARRQLSGGDGRGDTRGNKADEALRMAILAAFPDRVARRREPRARTVVLAAGGSAELGYETTGDWLVAVDAEERSQARGGVKTARAGVVEVRLGSTIEPEWLLDLHADRIEEVDRRVFDPRTERVERTTGLRYGALMLDETVSPAPLDDETSRLLADAVVARGPERLPGGEALAPLLQRLAFARRQAPDAPFPPLDGGELAGFIRAACAGRGSFAELGDPASLVLAALPAAAQRALHANAPERVSLASGRSVPIHYDVADTPWIESRLQDFFGTRAVPAVGAGRVALTVHLLAPNGRAVQVTRDLEGFWTQHYPALRRQLSRRYPKHSWPEDGATSKPPPLPPPRRPQR